MGKSPLRRGTSKVKKRRNSSLSTRLSGSKTGDFAPSSALGSWQSNAMAWPFPNTEIRRKPRKTALGCGCTGRGASLTPAWRQILPSEGRRGGWRQSGASLAPPLTPNSPGASMAPSWRHAGATDATVRKYFHVAIHSSTYPPFFGGVPDFLGRRGLKTIRHPI